VVSGLDEWTLVPLSHIHEEYGIQNGPKALKLQMKGAMDYTFGTFYARPN